MQKWKETSAKKTHCSQKRQSRKNLRQETEDEAVTPVVNMRREDIVAPKRKIERGRCKSQIGNSEQSANSVNTKEERWLAEGNQKK